MKLVGLEINGFKSFADKTKFTFDGGVTGIVGPNGCGKSNVIDAIRWVLGEQKTRNLRSDKMEDVIFNGTDKRKRANFADVTISFENTKNILPTEYTSIDITRRIYRDGDSEYYLNSVPCRLKDINALLLDTGVGADSYSIIALNMVEDLLKDKAGSRRTLFEEAAGVSRYKLRKKETLDKLKEVDHALERLEDVLFEVEKSYKLLERQAVKAEQYVILKEEYRKFSSQVAYLKIDKYKKELEQVISIDKDIEDKITGVLTRIAKHEARIAEIHKDLSMGELTLSDEQKKLNSLTEQIRERESEKQVRAERLKYLDKRKDDIENQIEQGKTQIKLFRERLSELEIKIDRENEHYDKQEFLLVELEQETDELKQSVHNRRIQLEEQTSQVRSKERALQNQLREVEAKEVELRSFRAEMDRYENDRKLRNEELSLFREKMEPLTTEILYTKAQIDSEEQLKIEIENQIQLTKQKNTELTEKLTDSRRNLDSKNNEYRLLKNLVDSLDGYPESVIYLKKNVDWMKNVPLVSDVIYCEPEYKVALEAYLEAYMNYYIVPTRKDAVAALQVLEKNSKGRVNFLILDELEMYSGLIRENKISTNYQPLQMQEIIPVPKIVGCDPLYQCVVDVLLGNAYIWTGDIFPDFEIPNGDALLQKGGAYISKKFAMSGGSVGVFEGKRLGRTQNLERLGKVIENLKIQINELEITQNDIKKNLENLRARHPQDKLEQLNRILTIKNQELAALKARDDQSLQDIERMKQRTEDIKSKIDRVDMDLQRLSPGVNTLRDEVTDLSHQLSQFQKEYDAKNEALSSKNRTMNDHNIIFNDIKNNIANLKKDFKGYLEQINNVQTIELNLREEVKLNQLDKDYLFNINTSDDDLVIQLYQQKDEQAKSVTFCEQRVVGFKTTIQQNENFIREERRNRDELINDKNKTIQRSTELTVNINSIVDRIQVEWQVDILSLTRTEIFGEEDGDPAKLSELDKKLSGLREKYNKFGEVNTSAIESYKETKGRYDFMVSQKNDLLESKTNLLKTIKEIDEAAREQFMDAFNRIRTNFIRVFRTLFTEQDDCDLILIQPEEPLESPIDILAKPKGKRPQTINALSGGEKTLTAISLLFAIYLIKPAPFCIFDEVDAPLDDANIDKFNNIIEEFSAESQFIVVTHNKRTMTRTNVIYGVTMEETGVSRVLPIDWKGLNLN